MKPVVMKFGGTSVGTPEAICRSAALVIKTSREYPTVVVVSALAGVTNLLLGCAQKAQRATWAEIETDLAHISHHHNQLIGALHLEPMDSLSLRSFLSIKIEMLKNSLAIIHRSGAKTPEQLDLIAAAGEQISAPIFAALLRHYGHNSISLDAAGLIATNAEFTRAVVLFEETNTSVRKVVNPLLDQGCIPVIPGFVGATLDGHTTTLGRGASDYTSAIVGAALGAFEVWNWTDVDGVLTADPRLAPRARIIPTLSYKEMRLLSACGAKVLHPDTVKPVADLGIPLRVRNSFNPGAPGTVIQGYQPIRDQQPLAVASRSKLKLVRFTDGRLPQGIRASYKDALTTASGDPLWVLDLDHHQGIDLPGQKIADTSLISVIGGEISFQMIHRELEKQHIPVLAHSQKNSDGFSFTAVRNEDTAKAVQTLHDHLIIQAVQLF